MAVHNVGVEAATVQVFLRHAIEERKARRVVIAAVDAAHPEEAVVGLEEHHVEVIDYAAEHAVVAAAPVEGLLLAHALDEVVLEDVVLGQDDGHLVSLVHHGAPQRGHHIAHPANLGDGSHLDRHVHHLERPDLAGAALDLNVVVPAAVVVKEAAAEVAGVREHDVHHRGVLRDLDFLGGLKHAASGGDELDWHPALRVLVAVVRPTRPDLGAPAKHRAVRTVIDVHLVACGREHRVGEHNLALPVAPAAEGLGLGGHTHNSSPPAAHVRLGIRLLLRLHHAAVHLVHQCLQRERPQHLRVEVLVGAVVPEHAVLGAEHKVGH
mmetsp:Transcript_39620/g.100497  ORF Transcript_39620/g.100497 Transcript_39620/m.100497 type:complete len:323 (+) Transcript_39620:1157-2125(+)